MFYKKAETFKLLNAITNVRLAVCVNDTEERLFTPSPRSSNGQEFFGERSALDLGGYYDQNSSSPRFQYQKPNYPSRPTPLPDLIEENETELPDPQADEPILVSSRQSPCRLSRKLGQVLTSLSASNLDGGARFAPERKPVVQSGQ